jgi:ribonuclease HI
MSQRLQLFSDGGARGNPGPAAIAFVALTEHGETVKTDASFIGIHTNNQAEYEALLFALAFAVEIDAKEVTCHLDSELVVKQLTGQYAVKDNQLHLYWRKVREISACFKKISFYNVRRTHPQIQVADMLVNKTLDEQARTYLEPKNKRPHSLKIQNEVTGIFVHASIRTSDLDRSIAFYKRFFGLNLLNRLEVKQSNSEIAFLQDSAGKGGTLELTFLRDQKKFTQPDYGERLFDHLGFEVKDLDKTLAEMRKENVVVTDEPYKFNEHTTIAFVEDCDGTLIELIEHK